MFGCVLYQYNIYNYIYYNYPDYNNYIDDPMDLSD